MTCIYGNPKLQHRHQVWDQLSIVAKSLNEEDEWITIGDFNQVLLTKDKVSFRDNQLKGVQQLRDCLDKCLLSEIPSKGQYLSWMNNRKGKDLIWEKLDRVFANNN